MIDRRRFVPVLLLAAALAGGVAHASPLTANGTQPGLTHPILPSGNCTGCHGNHDVTRAYEPGPAWQGSMMAQSGRDPLFWAALDVANADLPGVGDFCLRCHSPRAWYAGRSEPPAGSTDGCALVGKIDEPVTNNDFDGINCHFCHRVQENPAPPPPQPSKYFDNGQVWLDDGDCGGYGEPCRHGPYTYPDQNLAPPHAWAFSPYLTSSDMCATCHNVTNPVKNLIVGGIDAGIRFPIERTHREWQLSDYGVPLGSDFLTCQQCHMPDATQSPAWGSSFMLNDRAGNLGMHHFVGGNSWVPQVLKGEYPALGLDAQLDATTLLARELLQQRSAAVSIVTDTAVPAGQPFTATVRVTNLAGHKLPSGYPEGRRMWLHVAARDANDTLVWESGAYDPATGVLTRDAQVKVYEAKQGVWTAGTCKTSDAGLDQFHFVLNDCVALDNRIPPKGFTGAGDLQTAPVGYTYPETAPGSGVLANWDTTTYTIPVPPGTVSPITVTATLRYQTASKEYVDFLRDEAVAKNFPDDCIERTTGFPTTSRGELLHDMWATYGRSAPVDMVQAARVISVANPQYPIADPVAFKCQSAVSKAGAKFVGAKSKCILKCQANARKGTNPFTDCYPPYGGTTQFCVGDVAKGAQTKFAAAIVKGCTKKPTDCPICYSGGDCSVTGHAAATVASLESQLDAFAPAVACEQTTDKAKAKCIDGTAKTLAKFAASKTKCFDKCYANAQKGKVSAASCVPPATDDATEACIATAEDKAAAGIDKACFTAPAVAPDCYDGAVHPPAAVPSPDNGKDWVDLVELAVDATVPQTYCGP